MGLISNGTTIFDAGSMASGFGGSMVFIKKLTADGSATNLSFVGGASGVVLDNTYKEYLFTFKNIHPGTNNVKFQFNLSADTGSNYNVAKTTTYFKTQHPESDSFTDFGYKSSRDLAQGTGEQIIDENLGNDNDQNASGYLFLFSPSNTTFVKHFIAKSNVSNLSNRSVTFFTAGYGNTTSAINAVDFKMSSGNIDSGVIKMYGLSKS